MPRQSAPQQGPPVVEEHFRLLREYGRNPVTERLGETERRELWRMMCQTARIPYVDRETVVDAWKKFIGGQSTYSAIAMNGDIDPAYTTLGITYNGKMSAAHTIQTRPLLLKVLRIFARNFRTRTEFLELAEAICRGVADKIFDEAGNQRRGERR